MSKNITIAEGTQAKNFNNVAKIRTNVIGGGSQLWIPEDEAGRYANLEEISIDENGTYRASDEGLDGFSKVTVNVPESGGGGHEPRLITKNITANGTYNASSDGADGYSSVIVNVKQTPARIIVNGIDNAPVNQQMSTKDFFDYINEQAFNLYTSIHTTQAQAMWAQTFFREGGWISSFLHISDIYNYNNLVLVGAVGYTRGYSSRVGIWIWLIGIMDESASITITDALPTGCKATISNQNKYTARNGYVVLNADSGTYVGGSDGFQHVKQDINNHNTGADDTAMTITVSRPDDVNTAKPNSGLLTNLIGGTVS